MTEEQLKLVHACAIKPVHVGELSMEDWYKHKPHCLVHRLTVDKFEYWQDIGHGWVFLWDGTKWFAGPNAVFEAHVVCLGGSYGFDNGAIFIRAGEVEPCR